MNNKNKAFAYLVVFSFLFLTITVATTPDIRPTNVKEMANPVKMAVKKVKPFISINMLRVMGLNRLLSE